MVGKAEPLDVIIKKIPQPAYDTFRSLCGQPAAEEGKQSLEKGKNDETDCDTGKQVSRIFIQEDIIHEGTDQEVCSCSQQCRYPQAQGSKKIYSPKAFEQPPQALKATEAYNVLKISLIALFCDHRWLSRAREGFFNPLGKNSMREVGFYHPSLLLEISSVRSANLTPAFSAWYSEPAVCMILRRMKWGMKLNIGLGSIEFQA